MALSGAHVLLQDVIVSPWRHIHCHLQHTLPPGVRAVVREAEVINFAEQSATHEVVGNSRAGW